MKRLSIAATTTVVFFVPGVAMAGQLRHEYLGLYHQVAHKFGTRTPGRNIVRDGLSTGRAATDADVSKSITVLKRMLTPPPAPVVIQQPQPTQPTASYAPAPTSYSAPSSSGGYANVPGVPASFAACVAQRESTNGQGSSNIYGILGAGGQGSVASQKAAFARMYAASGTQPWAPYDGC